MNRDLHATLVVARRELVERVRSRLFVAITILGPIGMLALIVIPALIASRSATGVKIELVDRTGVLAQPLAAALGTLDWKPAVIAADTPDSTEMARIRHGDINGFLVLPPDALDGGKVVYRGDNGSSQQVNLVLQQSVTTVVQLERGKRAGMPADKLGQLLLPPHFEAQQTTGEAEGASGLGTYVIAYMLAFILYMVITIYGVAVMRSVVQEKSSRVMELMVATIKPRALMAGKILGVGSAGLLQIVIWLGIGAVALAYREQLLGWFGVHGGAGKLPALSISELAIVIVYFVLGFFFYASMYAAVGAMVSSEQDTQQMQLPVTMIMVFGILCVQMVSNDPRGTAAQVMTLLPFWSSMMMPMRFMLGGASIGELALSLAILLGSTLLIARAAAKIYRVGVLMYGKRPGLRELARWLKY